MRLTTCVGALGSQAALVVAGAAVLTCLVSSVNAGPSNSLMDISRDGTLLACSNRDSGTVTIVNLEARAKRCEVLVGAKPEGVSFVGATHVVAVAVYGDDKIVYLDADAGRLTGQTEVFDEPYGVVSDQQRRQRAKCTRTRRHGHRVDPLCGVPFPARAQRTRFPILGSGSVACQNRTERSKIIPGSWPCRPRPA